ncbi:MAG: Lrp/AsnC family transcriptional regulator [Lachnospiraceae bacterium]|nr:Lrp/AsnC family transcriptional regulator [Lachnospiraceae bacterium]
MRNEILRAIDKNGRITPDELAIMLGYDVDAVKKEIQEMEEEHIICGYPTLINWDKTDCERVTAWIEVKVAPQRGLGFDKIAERIYKFEEVESVYLISGEFDLAVMIEGKSMREVANFVSSKLSPLESVLSTSTNFILKKYKEHGLTLTDESPEDERMLITP